ncbi:MAG: hypothetical protein SNJ82_11640 [Gemmataceae bacterium]
MDHPRVTQLKAQWTDQYVTVAPNRPELTRFAGRVGRVVTVNFNARAIVDFADGAWYDLDPADLIVVTDESQKAKYNAKVNSAQPFPTKQS